MFVLELSFTADDRRLEARLAHRKLLVRLHEQKQLVMAGPWADDTGAMLIFNVDHARMEEILTEDPYYSTPGVSVVALREWTPLPLGDTWPGR